MNIFCYTMALASLFLNISLSPYFVQSKILDQISTTSPQHRKLLNPPHDSACSKAQIQVSQGSESSKGIPRYSVMVANLCSSCIVAQVHLHCGWFASANIVNPDIFTRLEYDDCLVNGGRPIASGQVIEFVYSNTFPYSLSVASYECSPPYN